MGLTRQRLAGRAGQEVQGNRRLVGQWLMRVETGGKQMVVEKRERVGRLQRKRRRVVRRELRRPWSSHGAGSHER